MLQRATGDRVKPFDQGRYLRCTHWNGWGRWFKSALLASLAHGIALVALCIAVGRLGTPLQLRPRVALRAQAEHLRFVAPASPAPALPNGSIGGHRRQRRLAADIPRGTLMPPPTDTDASVTAAGPAPAAAVGPRMGMLASVLSADPRLTVVSSATDNLTEAREREVNAAIASRVRAVQDSAARARRRWTVGVDTTHRFGIASCGIVVSVICIPFGFHSMPNPASAQTGIDPTSTAREAEVRAAIARIRPTE